MAIGRDRYEKMKKINLFDKRNKTYKILGHMPVSSD